MFRSKPRYDPEAFLAESPDRANRRGRQLIDNMNAFRETLQDRNADNLHFIHNQNIPSAIPPERLNALRREKPVMPASARRSGRHARAPSAEGVDELVQHLRDMDLNISQLQMLVDREVELWRLHPDKVSTYLNALNSVLEAQRNSNAEPEKCSADVPIPSEAANRREHYGRVGVPPSAHKHTSPEILHELHEHETDRKPVPIRTTGVQQPVAGSSQQAMVEAWEYEQTLFEFNAQMGAAAPQRLQQQTAIQDMLAAQAFSTENPNAELAQDRDSQYSEVTAASSFSRSHRDSKHESQDQDNFAARIMSGLFGDAPSVQKTLSELRDMLVNHPAAPHSRSDHLAPRAPASLAPSSEVRGSHENQVDIHGAVLSDEELATEEHIRDLLSSSQYDRQEKSRTSGLRRKSLALTEVGKKVAHGLSNMARSLRSRHKSMKLKAEASHDGAALAINSTDDVQSKREGKRPVRQTSSREAPASLLSPHDEDKLIREVLEQQRLMAAAAARALKDFQGSFLTECVCCGDEKNTGLSFPSRPPTDACEHAPKTCLECLDCWLASELAGKGCKALRCPDCLKEMEYEDVRRGASEKTREGYDGRLFLMALSEEPEFAWCLVCTIQWIFELMLTER
ncbi:uncharacterized protein RCC_02071 [Ramularia collo-cygni]|uniref:RING-type domain-containing protein n=1 Tax=Ramularia collo-cygni TaxID=112498 RepID=A0A2D3V3Z7_9PEZI|nr:uncharacterized protein RCC_02071 [Ramularia collo-cygni]CZT16229.1 uncharacterized protein RCC_02071 [Ramularia collo-cygni]